VNYRANIAALKAVGCTNILATTAVGSLREEAVDACYQSAGQRLLAAILL
jgi:purine nucleoside phosphorylase